MNEKTKPYQLTSFISPILQQEKLNEVIQNIKNWIINKGGSLVEEKNGSNSGIKKRLAYPIQKHKEAFYSILNFLLPNQTDVNQLNSYLNLEKNIIRYLITSQAKKPKLKPAPRAIDYKVVEKIEPFLDKEISPPKKKEERKEKVKIEELDKKLEEILAE